MKYFLLPALFTLALAAPRPVPDIGTWSGPITTVCETNSSSPAYTNVQTVSNHFKSNTYTCSHYLDEGDSCEVMFQNGKASVNICGPISMFDCSAVYKATQSILDFPECVHSYGGVKRVSGRVIFEWGTIVVRGAVHVANPVPISGGGGLLLDTSTPP